MKLVVATQNPGKLKEFTRILSPHGFEVISQQQAGADIDVNETGATFEENARIKALAIFNATGLPSVADDSGLCVDALGGRPGVYSARYQGMDSGYSTKMQALLGELEGVPEHERTAYFESAICLVLDAGTVLECTGRCSGHIGLSPAGAEGFGYDPIFMVGGKSYAEMSKEEKDAISHRGIALRKLCSMLDERK